MNIIHFKKIQISCIVPAEFFQEIIITCNGKPSLLITKVGIFVFLTILLTIPFAQNSRGLGQTANNLVYEIQPGESETLQWGLRNSDEKMITVTLNISGEGSEFVSFPKTLEIPPRGWVWADITVTIPKNHPNDVYLGPRLSALQPADTDKVVRLSFEVQKQLDIKIGNAVIPEVIAQPVPEKVETPLKQEDTSEQKEESKGSFAIIQPASEKDETSMKQEGGGGCLISTATFGSELSPQVQMLREIRDNTLLTTSSGTTFITAFNTLYYSFSPTIADLERQSPIFKEAVKLTLTPLITSLSILSYVDIDSEAEVLGYGISLIILNVAMYFVAPALIISRLRR